MASTIDARLRYPFQNQPALPEDHHEFLTKEIHQPYGDSMRQIIAMPLGYSTDHAGAHLQLVNPRAYVKTGASLVAQPFHTTALHRIYSPNLTEHAIREEIVPAICARLNEIGDRQQEPVTIESHFDPRTHSDSARWEPDPSNMSIRFVGANTSAISPRKFFIRVETRANRAHGAELHKIAENMTAKEFANDPRVLWSSNLQKRSIGRMLDICAQEVEKHTNHSIADRVNDNSAKVVAHEFTPQLAVHNGPMSVSNTVRYIEPQFKASPVANDPRIQGMVGFYANCAGEVSKGALLEGNHNEPLYELHGAPELHQSVGNVDGQPVYRSPVSIQNSVFNALPSFQPRLSVGDQQNIINSYEQYPSRQEAIQRSIVSLSGSKDLSPYFSKFRTPTEAEMKAVTCDMSKRAFGLSGTYQTYDPIVSIVP